jgi:hypothetical protein
VWSGGGVRKKKNHAGSPQLYFIGEGGRGFAENPDSLRTAVSLSLRFPFERFSTAPLHSG